MQVGNLKAGPALRYPLHFESLTAGLMFYVMLGIFFALYQLSAYMGIVLLVLWLVLCGPFTVRFIGMLLEYGMDILLATAQGAETPPPASSKLAMPRVRALLLVLALWAGIALQLERISPLLSLPFWALLCALIPAFIINNTLFSAEAMLSPASLMTTVRRLGSAYVARSLMILPAAVLFFLCLTGPFVVYLLLFPVFLYCAFQFFHQLGLAVQSQVGLFLPMADFKADRRELQAISASLADINAELSEAYEWMRAGDEHRVLEQVDRFVQRKGWGVFDKLFHYVSEWPYPSPALHLCRRYLEQREALLAPMRALELAQWVLARDAEFTLPCEHLQTLAEHAVIPAQYRSLLQMIENRLARFPGDPQREQLLLTALDLAAYKLKDEESYARLKMIGPG
jgi:hypothetical protein